MAVVLAAHLLMTAYGQSFQEELAGNSWQSRRNRPAPRTRPSAGGPLFWNVQGAKVYPVIGADFLIHLSYQLYVTNRSAVEIELKSFDVVDPDTGYAITGVNRVVALNGEDVTGKIYRFNLPYNLDDGTNYSTKLGAGQLGAIYVDLTYQNRMDVPRRISHRIVTTITAPNGTKTDYDVTDDPTPVSSQDAVVVTPPLRGDGWVNFNGCCLEASAHRAGVNAVDGGAYAAEIFAIDFLQVDSRGVVLARGDGSKASDYLAYGSDVYAAADGLVIEVVSNIPELPPGTLAPASLEQAAGNRVVVDIGEGRYALYAHLQPGSPTVRAGQRVTRGQKLGLLGTSGNSDAPHLHFQIMDSPSSLKSHGLPFVFDRMEIQGKFPGSLNDFIDKAMVGAPVQFSNSENGPVYARMPLVRYVMGFK